MLSETFPVVDKVTSSELRPQSYFALKPEQIRFEEVSNTNSMEPVPKSYFRRGEEITDEMLEAGIASGTLTADQLRLERNLIWRQEHPNAVFNNPALESAINAIMGEPAEPRRDATTLHVTGQSLENATKLQAYESCLRTRHWRQNNSDRMLNAEIPSHLTAEQISQAPLTRIQDAINDLYAENGAPFASRSLREWYQQLPSYQPTPRFEPKIDFDPDETAYLDALVERRNHLKSMGTTNQAY